MIPPFLSLIDSLRPDCLPVTGFFLSFRYPDLDRAVGFLLLVRSCAPASKGRQAAVVFSHSRSWWGRGRGYYPARVRDRQTGASTPPAHPLALAGVQLRIGSASSGFPVSMASGVGPTPVTPACGLCVVEPRPETGSPFLWLPPFDLPSGCCCCRVTFAPLQGG